MIDFSELENDGEKWELFARDFFQQLGFIIESSPDRGPDDGKDMIINEIIHGKLSTTQFRWLVSCKNFSKSGKSVSENTDEQNILERCESFSADGFIGFYSTLASSGLNKRLNDLKKKGKIKDYKIFDYKLIENYLMSYGFSQIILSYFPESYKRIRPIHKIVDKYIELKCDCCGKDLLVDLYNEKYNALVSLVYKDEDEHTIYKDFYVACKGQCDKRLEMQARSNGYFTTWKDLSDLAKPNFYLHYILSTINQLHSGAYKYEDIALKKEKHMLMALAQKVFHEVTEDDRKRFLDVLKTEI